VGGSETFPSEGLRKRRVNFQKEATAYKRAGERMAQKGVGKKTAGRAEEVPATPKEYFQPSAPPPPVFHTTFTQEASSGSRPTTAGSETVVKMAPIEIRVDCRIEAAVDKRVTQNVEKGPTVEKMGQAR
jgi:hypothetical protein